MDTKILNYVIEKTHELMNAASCSNEAKTAAKAWLDAVGTEQEAAETKKYVAELEDDILPTDMLVAFAGSDKAIQVFGADTAKKVLAHAKRLQAAGTKYCDCEACTAAAAIVQKKNELL